MIEALQPPVRADATSKCRGFTGLWTVWLSLLVVSCTAVFGQGTVTMNTGSGNSLLSEVILLPAPLQGDAVELEFGFATDEVFVPEQIFDSLTITFQSVGAMQALILVTLDVSGASFLPGGGGIEVDPAEIDQQSATYPSLSPVLAVRSAYVVSMPVAPALVGVPLQVFFDLFDNQNGSASQGYFANVTLVAVPEPGASALGVLGIVAGLARWRFASRERRLR